MAAKGPIEVALSTDLRGAPYSFNLWDVHTGAQLVSFKGNNGSPISSCLHLINQDYFLTAIDNIVQIWSIYSRKSQDQKLFLPGRPTTLIASPCGNYLIVGISEMIYTWQLASGNLLAHTQRHYQTVIVLRMALDGTLLFSGGEDGLVLVWPFADLISNSHATGGLGISETRVDTGVNEPRFSWQHHSAKVSDIHITNSGLCLTSSCDKTVNIYNYNTGKRLHCIADWPSPISCLVMNKNETRLFLGAHDGNIYELAISSLSLSLINSRQKDENGERKPIFVGHKDRVSRIVVSLDGTMLISASHDSSVKIWDILSGKMLRDVKHQAPVANLVSFLVPDAFALTSMTRGQVQSLFLAKPLKRNLYKPSRDVSIVKGELFEEASTTIVGIKNKSDLFEQQKASPVTVHVTSAKPVVDETIVAQPHNAEDVASLKTRLRELYLLSAEKIFNDVATESLKPYKDIVDDIDRTIPRESRKERLKKKKITKRKAAASDDDFAVKKKIQVNGTKKSNSDTKHIFV